MSVNKIFSTPPIALTTTLTTNLFNPGTTTGGVNSTADPYDKLRAIIRHICVVNRTAGAVTFTLFKGATGANAAGTEIVVAKSVPANDWVDKYYPAGLPFDVADFLVGGASANTSLTIQLFGELGIY